MSEQTRTRKKQINWEKIRSIAMHVGIQAGLAFISGMAMAAGQSSIQKITFSTERDLQAM